MFGRPEAKVKPGGEGMFKVHRRAAAWLILSAGALGCAALEPKHTGEPDRDTSTCAVPERVWFRDHDGDGYGDPAVPATGCEAPEGYVVDNTDCDDAQASVHPGLREVCDGLDQDCDGKVDEGQQETFFRDSDGDGYGDPNVTADACAAPDGYVSAAGDCRDDDPEVHQGSDEVCAGGVDEDCDALLDCEDDACNTDGTCVELDCADGLDGDEDGYTDCGDDDCWGVVCPTTVRMTVHGGEATHRFDSGGVLWMEPYCSARYVFKRSSWVDLESVTGTLRVYGPEGSVLRACDWTVERASFYTYFRASSTVWRSGRFWTSGSGTEHTVCYGIVGVNPYHVARSYDHGTVRRPESFTIDPDCGVDESLLPTVVYPATPTPGPARPWSDENGDLWYNIEADHLNPGATREVRLE